MVIIVVMVAVSVVVVVVIVIVVVVYVVFVLDMVVWRELKIMTKYDKKMENNITNENIIF